MSLQCDYGRNTRTQTYTQPLRLPQTHPRQSQSVTVTLPHVPSLSRIYSTLLFIFTKFKSLLCHSKLLTFPFLLLILLLLLWP